MQLMTVNPKRRKTRRKTAAKRKRNPINNMGPKRRNYRAKPAARRAVARRPARRSLRNYRRNPSPRGMMAQVTNQLMPAAIGAGGALALDIALGYIPLPPAIKTGPMRHLVKAAGAIGIGMLAGMVVKKGTAADMSKGALTVIMHDAAKEAVQNFAPAIPMGDNEFEMMDYGGDFDPEALGYMSPAPTFDTQPGGMEGIFDVNDNGMDGLFDTDNDEF